MYKNSFFGLEVRTCHTIYLSSNIMKLKIGGVEWGGALHVVPVRNCLESDETVSRNKKSEGRDTVMS